MQEKTENLVIGDPMQPKTQIGALISDSHLQNVLGHIRKAEKQGAHILTGGKQAFPENSQGGFYRADHFDRCHDEMDCVREEIFGPVMSVLTFASEEEAVSRANNTPFGWVQAL